MCWFPLSGMMNSKRVHKHCRKRRNSSCLSVLQPWKMFIFKTATALKEGGICSQNSFTPGGTEVVFTFFVRATEKKVLSSVTGQFCHKALQLKGGKKPTAQRINHIVLLYPYKMNCSYFLILLLNVQILKIILLLLKAWSPKQTLRNSFMK